MKNRSNEIRIRREPSVYLNNYIKFDCYDHTFSWNETFGQICKRIITLTHFSSGPKCLNTPDQCCCCCTSAGDQNKKYIFFCFFQSNTCLKRTIGHFHKNSTILKNLNNYPFSVLLLTRVIEWNFLGPLAKNCDFSLPIAPIHRTALNYAGLGSAVAAGLSQKRAIY